MSTIALAGDVELNPGPDASPPAPPAPPGVLTAYHVNARSLKKQLGDLRAVATVLEGYDIVAITETWLSNLVADSELCVGFDQHTWFRRDRGTLGGGVACAVRTHLLPVRLPDPDGPEALLLRLQGPAVTVAVCYRPPDDDAALQKITAALTDAQTQDGRLLVLGDFNLPEIVWTASPNGATANWKRRSNRAVRFVDDCDMLGLKQWVCEPTRGGATLDLVLSRRLPAEVLVRDSLLMSDHKETIASCSVPVYRKPVVTRRTAYNYKRADFDGLRRCSVCQKALSWPHFSSPCSLMICRLKCGPGALCTPTTSKFIAKSLPRMTDSGYRRILIVWRPGPSGGD